MMISKFTYRAGNVAQSSKSKSGHFGLCQQKNDRIQERRRCYSDDASSIKTSQDNKLIGEAIRFCCIK